MIKDDFPYFKNSKNIYLDSAATTQKPYCVLESVKKYYTEYCSNTHRGSYEDGNRATVEYEGARSYIRDYIGASDNKEIIFTKGVTEGINMVASSFVQNRYKTVIISSLEHHSNIVPWHMLGYSQGKGLEVVRYKKNLVFDIEHFEELLKSNKNSFVSVTHVSNAFGVIHPVEKIVELAHKYDAPVLIDGAQSLSRLQVDLNRIGADFYVVSSHKSYGPTGVGVLYIKNERLESFKPYQTGGATIEEVSYSHTKLLEPPYCFEAGTQNIAGVIGFRKALEYINSIGYKKIEEKEKKLINILLEKLNEIDDVYIYSGNSGIAGNISFNIKGVTPIDIGILLDKQHIAVRCGNHCAMPIMNSLNIDGTVRVSLGIYNDESDIDKLITALRKALSILRR